jgi:hypothetical protein
MSKLSKLTVLVDQANAEGDKFYGKNNKAAGTRLRKVLQEIKVLATDIRKDVSEKKNNL